MNRPLLLDASLLVDLERETRRGELGPAAKFLASQPGRPVVVSVVTIGELIEGAVDERATLASMRRFVVQGVHLAQAQQCARLQRHATRRMGENDAWLVATAQLLDADIAGADRAAFERLGPRYLRFR